MKGERILNDTAGRTERELGQRERGLDSTAGAAIYYMCHRRQDAC